MLEPTAKLYTILNRATHNRLQLLSVNCF